MKRFWKIFGITLGAIVAVVAIVALIAVYVVFTPAKLTPIVRNVADDYITAQHEIGDVELTFFSTFPNVAIKINGLLVVNPMPDAQSDTVLHSPEVFAELDLMQLLKGRLIVDGLQINKTSFNGFIDEKGEANFDVLNLEPDTLEEDTSEFSLPFEQIKLSDIELGINRLSFVMKDTDSIANTALDARTAEGLVKLSNAETSGNSGRGDLLLSLNKVDARLPELNAKGNLKIVSPVDFDLDDMRFFLQNANLDLQEAVLTLNSEQYINYGRINLRSTILAELNDSHYNLKNTRLTYNEYGLGLNADVIIRDTGDIHIIADADIKDWNIAGVMALLPEQVAKKLNDLQADGMVSLQAKAKGVYGKNSMPVVDARLQLSDGQVSYKTLPFDLKATEADLTAHLDMNDSSKSVAYIERLVACALDSKIDAFGDVDYLLASDMGVDLTVRFDVNLPDVKGFLPETMILSGRTDGKVRFKGKIADLTEKRIAKTVIDGNAQIKKLDFKYDSLYAKSDKADLTFKIPNVKPSKNSVGFLRAQLNLQGLDFAQGKSLMAKVGATHAVIESSNLLSNDPLLKANVKFNTDRLQARTDSMKVELSMPDLKAYAVYNTKDSTAVPQLDADFAIEDIDFYLDTIEAHITEPHGVAHLSSSSRNSKEPAVDANVKIGSVDALMGKMAHIKTDNLALAAKADRNSAKENLLLQWNPEVSVQLRNGDIAYQGLATKIQIPDIDFDYSNQDFNITEGKVLVGKSDFALSGEIRNIGPWLDNTGDLRGELVLVSDYTDVPEIMSLTSGIGGEEESQSATAEQNVQSVESQEGDPYMVPKGVHLSLNTQINRALLPFVNETAYDLGGGVYVRDGVLVIEEMGFICNAAKLQLTAMYETPRRNNLFVGLDYHMIDIDLERLVDMIPQVDTVLPMLRSFRGNAEFHLAAETYLNSNYDVKWSTTRGACSIAGHDLTLIDGQTFTTVAKLLNFKNKKAENQVDSISAEITLFRKEIDVYPFLMTMDKYKAAVGGRHNLDMTCNYHVSLLSPAYMGVNISGALDDIIDKPLKHIKLEKAKYAQDFLPQYRGEVESQNQTLRQMIREALKENLDQ